MSPSSQAVNIQAVVVPAPEHIQDLESALRVLVQASRTEPGCQRYELLRLDRPDGTAEFHVQERYDDRAAVQAHHDAAHYQAFRDIISTWLAQPPSVLQLSDVDVRS